MFEQIISLVPESGRITYAEFHTAVLSNGLQGKLQQGFNQLRKSDLQLVNEVDPDTGAIVTYVQRRGAEGQGV